MTTNMTENVSLDAKKNRNWKIRSIAALSIILFFILFILLLVYSNIGLKLTVFTLNKILPELKIERTEGSLSDLHLTQFLLQLDGVTVQINDASLSISGTCLLQGRICIKNFNAHNVLVRVNTEAFPHTDNHPNTNIDSVISDSHERWLLKMPLPIELNSTHLTGVNVYVDDMQFSMADFKGKAIWVNEKLYVYPSVAEKLTAKFPDEPNTQHQASNPAAIHEILNNLFNQPLIDSLPHVNIPLDINVASLTGNDWLLRIGGEDYQFKKILFKRI